MEQPVDEACELFHGNKNIFISQTRSVTFLIENQHKGRAYKEEESFRLFMNSLQNRMNLFTAVIPCIVMYRNL